MILDTPISNEEAAKLIRGKDVVSREVFASMEPELKARAFTITRIEDMDLVQGVRDEIAGVMEGADWFQTRDNIAAGLYSEWEDPDVARRRATLLLRQHAFQAQAATRWRDMKATAPAFPYWQYVAFGDSRVRPSHQALDGLVLPEDDPFWIDHYPPWDWGCRCMVLDLSLEEYFEELEKDAERDPANRKVLTPEEAERMRTTGQLTRGGQTIDVRSPRKRMEDKGEDPAAAFSWNPGDMGLPIDDVAERWDEDVREAFWASADAEPYEGGGSVGDWLRGARNTSSSDGGRGKLVAGAASTREAHEMLSLPERERGKMQLSVKSSRRKAGREAGAFMETLVHKDYLPTQPVAVLANRGRGFYQPGLREAHVRDDVGNAVHELMHAVEKDHPELYGAALGFRDRRTMGEVLPTLRALTGNNNYRASEVAYRDEWEARGGSVYAGKVYPENWGMTEVLTVGMEQLYNDPVAFARDDPDFFDFLLNLLQKR